MKRAPLRTQSSRRQRESNARAVLRKHMLEDYPWCFRCYWERAIDLHELKNRSQGGDFLDRKQIVTLCRGCHTWITDHPLEAWEQGWTFRSHEQVSAPTGYEDAFCPAHRLWAPLGSCCDERAPF